VDRDFARTWQEKGSKSTADRAHERVEQLVTGYEWAPRPDEVVKELEKITVQAARACGLQELPPLSG